MACCIGCERERSPLEAWNTYTGKFLDYHVRIEDSMRDGIWERIVHLEPINGYEKPHPKPFAITGHDYDGDGIWEKIFIRSQSRDGYNAVRMAMWGWAWEPCSADKDRVKPFTNRQIEYALTHLNYAMERFHSAEHRVSKLRNFRKTQVKGDPTDHPLFLLVYNFKMC